MQLELLDQEEKIIRQLKQNYRDALAEIKTKVRKMKESPSFQGKKAYQMKYQMMLEAQLQTILHKLGEQNVEDMTGYLDGVYREAYLGCLYGMHGDGVDLLLQVDETKVQKCINKDTKDLKFSQRLYENVDQLKDTVKDRRPPGHQRVGDGLYDHGKEQRRGCGKGVDFHAGQRDKGDPCGTGRSGPGAG